MRNLIIFSLMLFLVASISLDAFADTSPTSDHGTVPILIGNAHVGTTDLIPSFEVQQTVILIVTDNRDTQINRKIVNRCTNTPILSTIDFAFPSNVNDININRSDCNYPITSFLPTIVQRSYSELSTKDYSQRNTNVVPIENINSPRTIKVS